jgi:hypothetical protein
VSDDCAMSANDSAKQQLPFPYNQDLSSVLKRLDRRTLFSQERLANDSVTSAYLAAGLRLIHKHLGPGAERPLADPDDQNSVERPVLAFLSQRRVTNEIRYNPDPFVKVGSIGTLRSTWRSQSDYVADLLSFALWYLHEPAHDADKIAPDAEQVVAGTDFVDAAHRLCFYDLTTVLESPHFRLELLTAAAADGDEILQQALADNQAGAVQPWKQLYEEMFKARGLRLRPGISLDDFAEMLASLVSGYGLRGIGSPSSVNIDIERKRSMFGTAALALLLGCTEDDDAGRESISVEDRVHELIYGERPDPAVR